MGSIDQLRDFFLNDKDGIGTVGVGFVILLGAWLYIFWKYHILVRDSLKDEIDRVTKERDRWQNIVFEQKLKSSNSDHYKSSLGNDDADRAEE